MDKLLADFELFSFLAGVSLFQSLMGGRGTVVTAIEVYFIFTNFTAIILQSGSHSGQGGRMCTQAGGLHRGSKLKFSS